MDDVEIKFNKYPSTIKTKSSLELGIKRDISEAIDKIISSPNNS